MVGSSCCLSCGIAIAPKTSATIEISPIRALCARLNLDSQDMGGSLFCGVRGRGQEGEHIGDHPSSPVLRSPLRAAETSPAGLLSYAAHTAGGVHRRTPCRLRVSPRGGAPGPIR